MNDSTIISIDNLNISLKSQSAVLLPLLASFSLTINEGEYKTLSSPTGTGKTTLLNYIAGILECNNEETQKRFEISGSFEKIQDLQIAYAFQEPRLIQGISVLKNVMLPLENQMTKQEAKALSLMWLQKLNLFNKEQLQPSLLSGGEQQRAGLARAFAYSQVSKLPCLLLLDEPFASQDQKNAENIKNLILEQIKLPGHAALIVSHSRA